jgi:RNA polymerase sigma factor (TIGR02999 family)
MDHVTQLLNAVEQGDPHAASQLLPVIYDELRRLAAHRLAHEAPGQTLQPTALVHEAYLRLVARPERASSEEQRWAGRDHFFAAAAEAMRRILVDNARRKRCIKRGGGLVRRELDEAELLAPEPREDLLALDDALTQLAALDRAAAELVQLRYFGGLPMPEAARILGISLRTAERLWTYARAWLHQQIKNARPDDDPS